MRKTNYNSKISTFLHIVVYTIIIYLTMFVFMGNVIAATEVIIKGSVVNIRSGPGTNYSKITSVKKGEKFKVIKTSNGWYNIALDSKRNGWALGKYLTVNVSSTVDNNNSGNTSTQTVIIRGTTVNVRKGPGTNYSKITSVKKGARYKVIKSSKGWYNIDLGNKKNGWVIGSLVDVEKTNVPSRGKTDRNSNSEKDNKIMVKGTWVNVRSGPGTNYKILTTLKKGNTVPYTKISNNWYNVVLPDKKNGWVIGSLVTVINKDNNQIITDDTSVISDEQIATQDYIQVIFPKAKGIMKYTAKTYQDPYRLVVTVNNVDKEKTTLTGIEPDSEPMTTPSVIDTNNESTDIDSNNNPPDINTNNNTSGGEVINNLLVSKVEVAVDPVNKNKVTYTYYLSQPIHYTVYSTPGDYNGADTDSYDKKVTIKITPLTIKGKTIVIDAGHGGSYPDPRADSGAVARDSSGKIIYKEKDFNLSMALLLADRLKKLGANVILTRSTDVYIPLYNRTRIANQAEADIFISIHANSGSSTAIGSETIKNTSTSTSKPFLNSQSKLRNMLAEAVQKNMVNAIGTKNRGYYEDQRGLAVLKTSRMPSILVEVGFLSNPTEVKNLMSATFRGEAADGIAAGIKSYFTTAK